MGKLKLMGVIVPCKERNKVSLDSIDAKVLEWHKKECNLVIHSSNLHFSTSIFITPIMIRNHNIGRIDHFLGP